MEEDYEKPKLGTFVFEFDEYHVCGGLRQKFLMVSGENRFNVYENLGSRLDLPNFYASMEGLSLAGSCHGVLCFYYVDVSKGGIVLCNPATRKIRLLPQALEKISSSGFQTCFVAFGFEVETSDYKVLCIKTFRGNEHSSTDIQIYMRSTDSWRWIDSELITERHCKPDGKKQGRYLNGKYFCMGNQGFYQTIVSFDFNKEVFRAIPVPGDDWLGYNDVIQLDSIGDKLACIRESSKPSYFTEPKLTTTFEVWLLNDFNENYTWTVAHKINIPAGGAFDRWEPMAISRNGEFGFVSYPHITTKLYNFATGEMEYWDIGSGMGATKVYVYKESLVSV